MSQKALASKRVPLPERYSFRLQKLHKGPSCRITRFYGSKRVIRVSVPDSIAKNDGEQLVGFFTQRFLLNGRIFQALHSKDSTVYLVETSRLPCLEPDLRLKSLWQLINWHNPIETNATQVRIQFCLGGIFDVSIIKMSPTDRVKMGISLRIVSDPFRPHLPHITGKCEADTRYQYVLRTNMLHR